MSRTASADQTTDRSRRRWYGHGAFVTFLGFVLIAFVSGALFAAIAHPGNEDWVWFAAAVVSGGLAYVVYRFLIVRVLERRRAEELILRGDLFGQGLALGAQLADR